VAEYVCHGGVVVRGARVHTKTPYRLFTRSSKGPLRQHGLSDSRQIPAVRGWGPPDRAECTAVMYPTQSMDEARRTGVDEVVGGADLLEGQRDGPRSPLCVAHVLKVARVEGWVGWRKGHHAVWGGARGEGQGGRKSDSLCVTLEGRDPQLVRPHL
jgi:hypothetical protein